MIGDPGQVASCACARARAIGDVVLLTEESQRLSKYGPHLEPRGKSGLKGSAISVDTYAVPPSDGQTFYPSSVPTQRESASNRPFSCGPSQFPALAGAGA
jgi:hypothetical protein